jgi:hypothetical protein
MIRIVCHEADAEMAGNVGGPVQQSYKTFDVDLPNVEAWLESVSGIYKRRQVVGIEILADLAKVETE